MHIQRVAINRDRRSWIRSYSLIFALFLFSLGAFGLGIRSARIEDRLRIVDRSRMGLVQVYSTFGRICIKRETYDRPLAPDGPVTTGYSTWVPEGTPAGPRARPGQSILLNHAGVVVWRGEFRRWGWWGISVSSRTLITIFLSFAAMIFLRGLFRSHSRSETRGFWIEGKHRTDDARGTAAGR